MTLEMNRWDLHDILRRSIAMLLFEEKGGNEKGGGENSITPK